MKKLLVLTLSFFLFSSIYSQSPEMITVEGGSFIMGNNYSDNPEERPEHEVNLKSFQIAVHEITFTQYDSFCEATGKSKPDDGGFGRDERPAMNVSWEEATMYCNWMSKNEKLEACYTILRDSMGRNTITCNFEANGYRLPTEAEWEFASKGGTKSKFFAYSGSSKLDEVAWYLGNSEGETHEVKTKGANELGLYDMTGNVSEWCWDRFGSSYYKVSTKENPTGPEKGNERIYRGGRWKDNKDFLILTIRQKQSPVRSVWNIGFRVARNQ